MAYTAFDQGYGYIYLFNSLVNYIISVLINWWVQGVSVYLLAVRPVTDLCFVPLNFRLADDDLWHNHLQ
jgi:hypothetical protein